MRPGRERDAGAPCAPAGHHIDVGAEDVTRPLAECREPAEIAKAAVTQGVVEAHQDVDVRAVAGGIPGDRAEHGQRDHTLLAEFRFMGSQGGKGFVATHVT